MVGLLVLEGVVTAPVLHVIGLHMLRYRLGRHPGIVVIVIPAELIGVAGEFVLCHHLKRVGNAVIVAVLALVCSLGGVGGKLQV